MSHSSIKPSTNGTDVLNLLGVRTKKSPREGSNGPTGGPKGAGTKTTKRDQKGFGSDQKNAPKTPTKNNSVGTIMRAFSDGASNKY